ncbi:unnamed protein product [Alopecurus aequalis]
MVAVYPKAVPSATAVHHQFNVIIDGTATTIHEGVHRCNGCTLTVVSPGMLEEFGRSGRAAVPVRRRGARGHGLYPEVQGAVRVHGAGELRVGRCREADVVSCSDVALGRCREARADWCGALGIERCRSANVSRCGVVRVVRCGAANVSSCGSVMVRRGKVNMVDAHQQQPSCQKAEPACALQMEIMSK